MLRRHQSKDYHYYAEFTNDFCIWRGQIKCYREESFLQSQVLYQNGTQTASRDSNNLLWVWLAHIWSQCWPTSWDKVVYICSWGSNASTNKGLWSSRAQVVICGRISWHSLEYSEFHVLFFIFHYQVSDLSLHICQSIWTSYTSPMLCNFNNILLNAWIHKLYFLLRYYMQFMPAFLLWFLVLI